MARAFVKTILASAGIILLSNISFVYTGCKGGLSFCQFAPWNSWHACSRSCGGGTKYRDRNLCCNGMDISYSECALDHCGHDRSTWYDYDDCNTHCYNGGYRSGSRCACSNMYYDTCCLSECPAITECKQRNCTASYNVYCNECNGDNVLFKRYNNDKECQRMCSFNNHYCWPGSCSTDGLTKDCTCVTGFNKITNTGETSCQPTKKPNIITCDTIAIGPNGEKKRAMSANSSTECQHLQDMYGNYQPSTMQFDLSSEYTIDISNYSTPSFIVEANFGITDTTIYIKRLSLTYFPTTLSTRRRLTDVNSSQSVKRTNHDSHNLTTTYTLANGQALCLEYEVKGGGYLKAKDTRTNIVLSSKPYHKNAEQRTVCYRYDSQPPEHCSQQSTCTYNSLQLDEHITRSNFHRVDFNGWFDPVPPGGASPTASSIESYAIRVNEVLPSKGILKVDYAINLLYKKVNHIIKRMDLKLSSDTPKLYCFTLEVKDVADNVRQCRRFVLYDNTSSIQIWNDKPFRFTSASPDTDYTWQTHHNDVCVRWKDYFYNDFYINNELLNPIEPDPHGTIIGPYEQTFGEIPVSGTTNVYGIIAYNLSWSRNHGSFSIEIPVPSFTNQSFCKDLLVNDGELYTLNVKAIDIAGNTLSDSRTVFIDRSAPLLNDIWLQKDEYEMLFVHYSTVLSNIKIAFDAFDKHSGICCVAWTFGNAKDDTEILSGQIGGQRETCDIEYDSTCYCPQIGHCEVSKYNIDLSESINDNMIIGVQNEEYFFNISVKNNAGLISEKRITILVDETPPQVGNVSIEQSQFNDTNGTQRYIVASWQGFSDPESGIRSYRVGVNTRCLMKDEMYTTESLFVELSFNEFSTEIYDNSTCTTYITVVAINNALQPSSAVCIEGITKPVEDSCKAFMHEEDKTVLAVSLSTSGAIVVILCVAVVVYNVIKRRRANAKPKTKECRVFYHKDNVSIEWAEQEKASAYSPYSDISKGCEENPYDSVSGEIEVNRLSSVDNPTYMNLQLKPS